METNQSSIGTTNQAAESQTGIRIFENAQFGQIRTASGASGEPLFCLADLCKAIGINNPRMVRNRIDKDDVSQIDTIDNLGRKQPLTFVTESGMYDVILRSDSPQAKPFRKWVTSEVLPSIRKSGGYIPVSQEDFMFQQKKTGFYLQNKKKAVSLQHVSLLAGEQKLANLRGRFLCLQLNAINCGFLPCGALMRPLPAKVKRNGSESRFLFAVTSRSCYPLNTFQNGN